MSKILTTQLTGLFNRIQTNEEETIEDVARLLAQATIGHGNVYFVAFDEMLAVEQNALFSAAPFFKLKQYDAQVQLTEADRVCIFVRHATDDRAIALAKSLFDQFIPFAVVASEKASEQNKLSELAYVYVSLHMRGAGGLLPHATNIGERVVFPHLLAALFVYEAIKLSYDEIVEDYNESED